jgi:hypothetical protein
MVARLVNKIGPAYRLSAKTGTGMALCAIIAEINWAGPKWKNGNWSSRPIPLGKPQPTIKSALKMLQNRDDCEGGLGGWRGEGVGVGG